MDTSGGHFGLTQRGATKQSKSLLCWGELRTSPESPMPNTGGKRATSWVELRTNPESPMTKQRGKKENKETVKCVRVRKHLQTVNAFVERHKDQTKKPISCYVLTTDGTGGILEPVMLETKGTQLRWGPLLRREAPSTT